MTKAKYCSFCGKSEDEVLVLIAGPGNTFICDEDVDLCGDVVTKRRAGSGGVDGRPFSEFRAEVLAKVAASRTPTEAEPGEAEVDRVAKAICQNRAWRHYGIEFKVAWAVATEKEREPWREDARAAIAALRTPPAATVRDGQ